MKLSSWRAKLLTWLNSQLVVDSYSATDPEMGKTNAFLPPLEEVSYQLRGQGEVVGTATQQFQIAKRVPRDTKYRQIPIAVYEGLHSSLSILLVHNFAAIADLEDLEFLEVSNPIGISEIGEGTGEWLVSFLWKLKIRWLAELEDGDIVTPFNFTKLNLNLWRDRLDDDLVSDGRDVDKSVLDFTLSATPLSEPDVLTSGGRMVVLDI